MKAFLLSSLLLLSACQSNTDVNPVPLPDAITGTYQTNKFLDYTCLTLPANQMPVATIQSADAATFTLTLIQAAPAANVRTVTGVTIVRQDDQRVDLVQNGRVIGSVQTGRVFTASGMETQGRLLRISDSTLTFTGYQP